MTVPHHSEPARKAVRDEAGLLPCPFCGGGAKLWPMEDQDERRYYRRRVTCEQCDAELEATMPWATFRQMPDDQASRELAKDATEKWNGRASPAATMREPVYRFLRIGDAIEAGDECPSDNCAAWEPVNRWAVGMKASTVFKTVRRRVAPPPAPVESAQVKDGRPDGWTEALAISFMAANGHNPEMGMFAKSFNEGAWQEIEDEWPEFVAFADTRIRASLASEGRSDG